MKNLLISVITTLTAATFSVANTATAESLHPETHAKKVRWQSTMDTISIDEHSWLASQDIVYGLLVLNKKRTAARLELTSSFSFQPFVLEFKNLKKSKDGCGATVYTGVNDNTFVDGLYEELVVVDNTTSQCMYYTMVPGTEVYYKTKNVRTRDESNSSFSGPALEKAQYMLE